MSGTEGFEALAATSIVSMDQVTRAREAIEAMGYTRIMPMHDRWVASCKECCALVMVPRPNEENYLAGHHQWHVELSRALGLDTNA